MDKLDAFEEQMVPLIVGADTPERARIMMNLCLTRGYTWAIEEHQQRLARTVEQFRGRSALLSPKEEQE